MKTYQCLAANVLAVVWAFAVAQADAQPLPKAIDQGGAAARHVYATSGVHNDKGCMPPEKCIAARKPGEPTDPQYPAWWSSDWTMYRVFSSFDKFPPPYASPPAGLTARDYEVSYGSTYYDASYVPPDGDGQGAMMEHYVKRCLPIFPFANTFTCSFVSLGNKAYFLRYEDRPPGTPACCQFSLQNHPPRQAGLAWNSRKVSKVGETSVMSVSVDRVKEEAFKKRLTPIESDTVVLSRWPSAIKLSAGAGKSDFVVVPLHLKSNNGDPKELEGSKATQTAQAVTPTIRVYEWELLSQQIAIWRKEFTDDDIVLVGDVNTKSATEPVMQAMIKSGYVDCNSQDLNTYIKGKFASPFDRIIVRSDQPETKESCLTASQNQPLGFRVVRPADWKAGATVAQFNKFLSDHQMVVAGLCVGKDDD